MGIMARDATEPSPAGDEALTLVHLLDLADKPAFIFLCGLNQNRPEPLERQPRAIVVVAPVQPHDSVITDQVALFANRVP